MLFNKNDERANERILYQTKPNMILGCKKAIYGLVLLLIVLSVSPSVIKFIGEMQVYMISYVKLSLTRYSAIAFFVVILIIVIYIIWQLLSWHSIEYTLTDSRVIIKSGVLSTKKNYMPYVTIQDVNTSQSIFARLFNVGSISIFSAYDNNEMKLSSISNPSKVEEIIFSYIAGPRSFQPQNQRFPPQSQLKPKTFHDEGDFLGRNDFYDEFEPITPITHEKYSQNRREYEYYPEDFSFQENRHTYEYEPYDNRFDNDINYSNRTSQDNYYNEVRSEYSQGSDDYFNNFESETYYNEDADESPQDVPDDIDSSQKAIKRHFDKFKK